MVICGIVAAVAALIFFVLGGTAAMFGEIF